jgi:hypothetical protein
MFFFFQTSKIGLYVCISPRIPHYSILQDPSFIQPLFQNPIPLPSTGERTAARHIHRGWVNSDDSGAFDAT